jgi:protein-tyrosine phosphatase
MTRVARERGVHLTSISRSLRPSDLLEFDVVLGMDATNIRAIKTAAEHWRGGGNGSSVVPEDYQTKLGLMTDYLTTAKFKGKFNEVPDPYYGGQKGFELVLDLLEDACEGLLDSLQEKKRQH